MKEEFRVDNKNAAARHFHNRQQESRDFDISFIALF